MRFTSTLVATVGLLSAVPSTIGELSLPLALSSANMFSLSAFSRHHNHWPLSNLLLVRKPLSFALLESCI